MHREDARDADDEGAAVVGELVQCFDQRHRTTVVVGALRHHVAVLGSTQPFELDEQGPELFVALPRPRGHQGQGAEPVIVVAEAVEDLPATLRIVEASGPSVSPVRSHEGLDGLLLGVHTGSVRAGVRRTALRDHLHIRPASRFG